MKKKIVFIIISAMLFVSIFTFSACDYQEVAGIYHGVPSASPGIIFVLDLRANGNFTLDRQIEGGIRDTTFTRESGTFTVDDNRIALSFPAVGTSPAQTRRGTISLRGNIELDTTIYGVSVFTRQ